MRWCVVSQSTSSSDMGCAVVGVPLLMLLWPTVTVCMPAAQHTCLLQHRVKVQNSVMGVRCKNVLAC